MKKEIGPILINSLLLMLLSLALAYIFYTGFGFHYEDTYFILTLTFLLIGLVPSTYDSITPDALSEDENSNSHQPTYDDLYMEPSENKRKPQKKLVLTPNRISFFIVAAINLILSIV